MSISINTINKLINVYLGLEPLKQQYQKQVQKNPQKLI